MYPRVAFMAIHYRTVNLTKKHLNFCHFLVVIGTVQLLNLNYGDFSFL